MGFFDCIADPEDPSEISGHDEGGSTPGPDRVKPTRGKRIEKLSFLRPCPVCRGRSFTFGLNGGFFCRTCTPGVEGQPVEATGPDRDERTTERDPDLLTTIHVRNTERQAEAKLYFAAAWPWIREHLPDLLAAGWTRAGLLRRGKHRHPYGNWGVAWLPIWIEPSLSATIGLNGSILFRFLSKEQTIQQTASPTHYNTSKNTRHLS